MLIITINVLSQKISLKRDATNVLKYIYLKLIIKSSFLDKKCVILQVSDKKYSLKYLDRSNKLLNKEQLLLINI